MDIGFSGPRRLAINHPDIVLYYIWFALNRSADYGDHFQLMLPVPYHNSWSLYVVDVDEKTLLVKDPCETSNGEDAMKLKHEDNANHIIEGLRRCIHENIAGWYVPAQGWRVNYNVGMHPNSKMCVPFSDNCKTT